MTSKHRHNSTRRKFLQLAASSTLGSIALSGCAWKLADVRKKNTNRGSDKELYIYTWSSYTDQDLLKRFTQETGIKVLADVYDSNEVMLSKIQAGGGDAYSIIYPSDYTVHKMVELGLLNELDFSRITGFEQLFPRFINPEYDPGNLHSIPLSWGTTGLIYNTKKLQKAPEDWSYLWENQQQLSKRMTLLSDVREVMGAVLKMLGYSYNSRNSQHVQEAYQRLVELKPHVASFTSDAWRPQVLSGDIWLAMAYSSDSNEAIKENKDLQYVIPKSGSSLWTDTLVIPKDAPNINAAYAWINFLLRPEISAEICKRLSFATTNQAAYNLLPTELQENPRLFPSESTLKLCESVASVGQLTAVYDRYWTQLTSA